MNESVKADLDVEFCGVKFENPFLLASAPPTTTGEMMGRAFDAGWAGAVTKTLVTNAEAIVNVTPRLASLSYPGPKKKVFAFQNIELVTDRSLSIWLKEIEDLRRKHPGKIVIASIMDDASKPDGWQSLARQCESAGAQMIEINMSCPHGMPEMGMGSAIGQNPDLAALVTEWTVDAVDIPVMPKMTPNVTDVALVAQRCIDAGAPAVAAINTVSAIIGVDLETLAPHPAVAGKTTPGGLSGLAIKPIALKAIASIAQATGIPISGIGGIYSWEDAAEFLLLGASTLQICSAVMAKGYGIIDDLTAGLSGYLARKGWSRLDDMIGLALPNLVSHEQLSREAKVYSTIDLSACIKCGRCYVSCLDAGYQAITLGEDKLPVVDRSRCTGCSLCQHVCPVWNCISMSA